MEAPGLYLERLMRTIDIPERFQLTEEQLVQIAIEDNIQFTNGMHQYNIYILSL